MKNDDKKKLVDPKLKGKKALTLKTCKCFCLFFLYIYIELASLYIYIHLSLKLFIPLANSDLKLL